MDSRFSSICVIGLGYIGLPTASMLGTKGYDVTGVDVSPKVVETINRGEIHIVEPDLDLLVKSAVNAGKLKASLEPVKADVYIIAVPTPFKGDHVPDLSYVEQASRAIAPYIEPGNLVILESTSPVGSTEGSVAAILAETGLNVGEDVFVAHCPERVLPGRILIELIQNDRIVGGINKKSTRAAADFYKEFVSGAVLETDAKTAELSKLTENSFRDVNIAFANELSMICDREQIDVWELISLANRHPRVDILQPGPGVGGHCIAVDPWFIVNRTPDESKLIKQARLINDAKPDWVINKIIEKASKFKHPTISILGLAFKANVDDLRESPAVEITNKLLALDLGEVLVCEPNINEHKNFKLSSFDESVEQADILVVLVDHNEFKALSAAKLSEKIIIDTRGIIK